MRIPILIGKVMMLPMHRHPLTRRNSGEEHNVQMHQKRQPGMKLDAAVRQRAMQVHRREEHRQLQDRDRDCQNEEKVQYV